MSAATGCVDKEFREGLPCDDGRCPPGQSCFGTLCFTNAPGDGGNPDATTDAATQVDAGPCDPITQNCPGGACFWRAGGASYCGVAGSNMNHQPCAMDSQCPKGFGCVPSFNSEMRCEQYCDTAVVPDVCLGIDDCIAREGRLGLCTFPGCDVFLQTCMTQDACYYSTIDDKGLCFRFGAGTRGTACTRNEDCGRNLHCKSCAGGGGKCAPYCHTASGNADCTSLPAGNVCVPLEAGAAIGVCDQC